MAQFSTTLNIGIRLAREDATSFSILTACINLLLEGDPCWPLRELLLQLALLVKNVTVLLL